MNKFIAVSAACLLLAACGRAAPDAGEEGVLIAKPWFFGHGGVDPEPVKAGLSFTSWTTSTVYVSVVPQTIKEHFDDIMSSDGVPVSFDAYIKLQVNDSVRLVKDFSGASDPVKDEHSENNLPAWYANNLNGPLRNIIRDAVRKHGLNEIAITNSAQVDIEREAKIGIAAYISKMNIPVSLVDFSLGKANPPDAVRDQRVRTAAEQQRQITEHQTTLAEQARLAAEQARADADNAYRNRIGLTSEQFIQLQEIGMERQACFQNHCTFVTPGLSAVVGIK